MKKIIFNLKMISLAVLMSMFVFGNVSAQQVDYQGQSPIDQDLDGLTDQAEVQIYNTDSKNPDTDGDGYYDGTEILSGSNPLEETSIPGIPAIQDEKNVTETPWAWYISRVSGLIGFTLLYLSIFLGLVIRVPFLRRIFAPLYAMQAHCWMALQATLFAFVHGVILIFDKFMNFDIVDVLVPFASEYKPELIAAGIVGFYLMIIITISSYGRKFISQKLWRALHFTNIILYIFVIMHAYNLGTDMKNDIVRNIFIYANAFLVALMLVNMFSRIRENIIRKRAVTADNNQDTIQ